MVRFSAFADEVGERFFDQISFLVRMQVRYIELRSLSGKNLLDLDKAALKETQNILEANGIGVSAIGSPIGKVMLDQPFEAHLDRFKHALELADFFNAPFIRIFSYYAPEGKRIDDFRDEVIRRLTLQTSLMQGSGKRLVHENESHIYGYSAENCADLVRAVDSPNQRLVYDPANFVWGSGITDNMERCWPVMEPYVVHVHIKDWKLGSKHTGSMPGEGDAQIPLLLQTLADDQYEGFVTMEPHLESGGQFGGSSDPASFEKAIITTRRLCEAAGLAYE